MATGTLEGTTIAATYKSLLKVKGGAQELLTSTPKQIEDGHGTDSALWLATTSVLIGGSGTRLDFNTTGSGEYISGNGTALTLNSGEDINLTCATGGDVNIPVNIGLRFGDGNQHIETDNTDLTITSDVGININSPKVDLIQDTNFVTSGNINGMSIDGTTFSVDGTNNRIGIGTAAPATTLEIKATTATLRISGDGNDTDDHPYAFLEFYNQDATGDGPHVAAKIEVRTHDGSSNFGRGGSLGFYTTLGDLTTAERMRIAWDGKVGIGVIEPLENLSIAGIDDDDVVLLINSYDSDSINNGSHIRLFRARGTQASPALVGDNDTLGSILFGGYIGSNGDHYTNYAQGASIKAKVNGTPSNAADDLPTDLIFSTSPDGSDALTVRMALTSTGNVGIGTDSPDALLDVQGPSGSDGAVGSPTIRLTSSVSSSDWDTNDVVSTIETYTKDGSGPGARVISFIKTINEVKGVDELGPDGALAFGTSEYSGSFTAVAERMRILGNGNVGIGTNAPAKTLHIKTTTGAACTLRIEAAASNDAGIEFYENNLQWKIWNDGSLADNEARIYVTDRDSNDGVYMVEDATSWVGNSDERMKENLVELTNATTNLNTLRCVNYTMKDGSDKRKARKRIGLIAQDVYKIYPETTTGNPDDVYKYNEDAEGYKHENAMGISYTDLIPVLVKAVQELSAKVTALENA